MAGIFPPIFKQKDYTSDITENYLMPNEFKKAYREIIESSTLIGWIMLETSQLVALYLIYNRPRPELTDRRVK